MVGPVDIKGGYRLDLGQTKLDANGAIDLKKSISSREVEAMINHAKSEMGEAVFEQKKSNFEFRLKHNDGRAFLEFKERSAGGHWKASLGIGATERQRERHNAMQAIGNAFGLDIKTLAAVRQTLAPNATNYEAAKAFQSSVAATVGTSRALIAKLTSNPVIVAQDGEQSSASLRGIVGQAVAELQSNPFEEGGVEFATFARRFIDREQDLVPAIKLSLEAYDAFSAQLPDGLVSMDEAAVINWAVSAAKKEIEGKFKALTGDIMSGIANPALDRLGFLEALDRMAQTIEFLPDTNQTVHTMEISKNKFDPILREKSDEELANLFENGLTNYPFVSQTLSCCGLGGQMAAEGQDLIPEATDEDHRARQLQAVADTNRLGEISSALFDGVMDELKSRNLLQQPDPTKDVYHFKGREIYFNHLDAQNPDVTQIRDFIEDFALKSVVNGGDTTKVLAELRAARGVN